MLLLEILSYIKQFSDLLRCSTVSGAWHMAGQQVQKLELPGGFTGSKHSMYRDGSSEAAAKTWTLSYTSFITIKFCSVCHEGCMVLGDIGGLNCSVLAIDS